MNIDELFIKSESGRSSSLLASLADEELSERPDFDSIDDWKNFYKEKENYKTIVSFLFPKYIDISNLNDSICLKLINFVLFVKLIITLQ